MYFIFFLLINKKIINLKLFKFKLITLVLIKMSIYYNRNNIKSKLRYKPYDNEDIDVKKKSTKKSEKEKFLKNIKQIVSGDFFSDQFHNDELKEVNEKTLIDINKQLTEIHDIIIKDKPKLKDILESNISIRKKIILLEKYNILNNTLLFTPEFYKIKEFISSKLKKKYSNELNDIRKEIKYLSSQHSNSLKIDILKNPMNIQNKIVAYRIYKIIKDLCPSECYKERLWIKNLLSVPFDTYINSVFQLEKIRKTLDDEVGFLDHVKDELVNYVCRNLSNPNSINTPISICGNVGCGKTSIVNAFAKSLNRPLRSIYLG
jgi:ATP-dependent Lon protease